MVRQHGSEGLRAQSLKEIKGVQWIPDWARRVSSRWLLTVLTGVSLVRYLGRADVTVRAQRHRRTASGTLELMEEVAKRVEVDGIQAGGISMRKRSSATTLTSM